jgi:integrase
MWPNVYRRRYARAAGAASCSWSTPHDLRHYCASSMIRAGASAAMVAEVLGDSIATVLSVYTHFFPSDTERTRELLAAGLAAAGLAAPVDPTRPSVVSQSPG